MLKLLNLKDPSISVVDCRAILEIEIENCKRENCAAFKILHGYGSHGKGGVVLVECRRVLQDMKRRGEIKNYFNGDKWNLFDRDTTELLKRDKSLVGDEDLNKGNPGITIVIL